VSATLLLQVLVTAVPVLGAPLALVPLPPLGWVMAVAAAVLTVLLCDALRTDGTRTDGTRTDGMRRGEARDRGRRRRVTAEPGGSGDGQHEPGRI
jgi:Ca2+-transporting ATPase